MKDELKKIIRQVSITGKTYPDYIDAIADCLISSGVTLRNEKNEHLCVSCGTVIPEGRQVCPNCENNDE